MTAAMSTHPHPHTIVVVDDDPDIRETVVDIFSDAGFEVTSACNGREALQRIKAAERPPCVILLDLMMPVMDGAEFIEAQRKDPEIAEVPVVLVSATSNIEEKAAQVKPNAFLRKPLRMKELLQTVLRFCPEPSPV